MAATKLGINVDHIATLRQARGGIDPDPIKAADICERANCDSIVVHLREDRRHIQDGDVELLRNVLMTRLNLEMSISEEIVRIACKIRPDQVTLVPEKRRELTTEGGLDVIKHKSRILRVVERMNERDILVSLFVDPDKKQIKVSSEVGADAVEIHTGEYANAKNQAAVKRELKKIVEMARFAKKLGLSVYAGHGLNYSNVKPVAAIPEIEELNIGHSIISRAVIVGLDQAVKEMLDLIN